MDLFENHRVQEEEEDEGSGGEPWSDGIVVIRRPQDGGALAPRVVTVNCPDQTGLSCDLARVILGFGLGIVRGDVTTDGRWCYILFWVAGKEGTRWGLLRRRLRQACPTASPGRSCWFSHADQPRLAPQLFQLKLWCSDRLGLLHDVTKVLCELELIIRSVKVSTTPDGKVVGLFFITDVRELLHTSKRKEDLFSNLQSALMDSLLKCEIEVASAMISSIQASSSLPLTALEELLDLDLPCLSRTGPLQKLNKVTVAVDNCFSPSHTVFVISCYDHKGIVYDIMRAMKDHNIQISYGRFSRWNNGGCDIELLVMQGDGNKLTDACKKSTICSRLRSELSRPLLIAVMNRGPSLELLVANPVELSGNGRPLVFYDITCALKELNVSVFSANITRHAVRGREWEVYRLLISDDCSSPAAGVIDTSVAKKLMGWD